MPRYAQLVMGPAGSGKSTYCSNIVTHCQVSHHKAHVVNLDPAAETFSYPLLADVRDLVSLEDVMDDTEMKFGPNGGLVFCLEYLTENFDWLYEQIDDFDDDYLLFDCPGQIELYTHIPVMRLLVDQLQKWDFRVCGVFLIDSQFMIEASKFVSGVTVALSTMVNLEIPHVNVMSKIDLLSVKAKKQLERFLEPNMTELLNEEFEDTNFSKKFGKLNSSIANLIDDYSLVKFIPLDATDEDSMTDILLQIDTAIQYGEDLEPKEPQDETQEELQDDS